ncbi:hypothetical protein HDG34_004651 [Paraburkholderia sp. HC6.4b]|uniref:hypothetical protein n=1 Tax=unclassified Paraburkholderia TaxID=2615204 RepID=UPI001616821A|nr:MULTISPECIES: hypothetical protein [unclassified Paraburkholderia]MBB5410695.1 hypothetical protein [Paraburkholderia sp. HC6.4b]MBB5452904.1 hypothetical protein [Paraburkholderia sp. Kb1A]
MQTTLKALPIAVLISAIYGCGGSTQNPSSTSAPQGTTSSTPATTTTPSTSASNYTAGNLLISRTAYDPAYVVSGTLPYNATPTTTNTSPVTAVTPGGFPNVFTNDSNDANFGVTSEAYLDQWAPNATSPSQTLDVTALAAKSNVNFATSFASKSELALNVSLDQKSLTFTGYNASIDQLDISNTNTPGVVDTTNTDVATPTYRTVAQLNFADNSLSFTNTNAYAGNNSRAAVLANGMYYIVGNAGNSGKNPKPTTAQLDMLTMNTGVQSIAPGSQCAFTQVIGAFQSGTGTGTYAVAPAGTACSLASMGSITGGSSTGDQFGFSIASLPTTPATAADKTGKDANYRGLFVGPDGTMYVSKGSGGNGVNTVYQVGATGALANGGKLPQNAATTIVPGFPTALATNLTALTSPSQVTGTVYPFGMWIPASNPSIMFVADEGDSTPGDQVSGSGGLWVYQNQNGTWKPLANLTTGLNLGTAYTVTDTTGAYGTKGASYTTTPDGLRNITGQVNSDGSFTIYAVTSTIGNSLGTAFDAGADSNQLVKITVSINGSTVSSAKGFTVMQTAPYGQALRGVALVPKS